ncbi:MAG: riboflavin synthase [Spirochaetes bacterium]|nr:riboflavin synthase [Spirochaetota bacterium]
MFTGLIEEIGTIAAVSRAGDGLRLTVRAERVLEGTRVGDSICINGACQTVTALDGSSFTVFVSSVTASVTTLGSFKANRKVNLERAMTPSSRFGGHFVQGHVDGRGAVRAVEKDSMGRGVIIDAGTDLTRYIVAKGSVAVDGVSLTVVAADEKGFSLYFIPETLENTVLSEWKTGAEVNIEVDILAKYVERMLRSGKADDRSNDGALMKKLMEEGFV